MVVIWLKPRGKVVKKIKGGQNKARKSYTDNLCVLRKER